MPPPVTTNTDELCPQGCEQVSQPMPNGETKQKSILALEEQIREHEAAIVKLKRARNSLLNISKLPPELLGDIFCRNATFKGDFGGFWKRSRNFLLVCHHWFEVASSTPEVWSFWGNTPKDWARLHQRSGSAPLDLVLSAEWDDGSFDAELSNVLQDRATQDTIRRIHLKATDSRLLKSIISSLTTDSKELRSSGVESFMLENGGSGGLVDISDFFAHYHFPRLQRLEFYNCMISSWNLITSRIATLTILDLDFFTIEPTPTTSQVLSILASNPTLRKVAFSVDVTSADDGDVTPPPRVPLRHLKELKLDGHLQGIFGILDRLDLPRDVDILDITLDECAVEAFHKPSAHAFETTFGIVAYLSLDWGFPFPPSLTSNSKLVM